MTSPTDPTLIERLSRAIDKIKPEPGMDGPHGGHRGGPSLTYAVSAMEDAIAALAAAPAPDARLREALERIADPELVDAPGGFYCPWCGTNVNVHGTTCPVFIARAALSRQAEKETV